MNNSYPSDVLKSFGRWAVLYRLVDLLACGIREKVFHYAAPRKGEKILDVCTGTGRQAFAFGRRGFEVTGLDLSEDMLRIAVKDNQHHNVRFVVGDGQKLPHRENSFDLSCISFGLHEMPLPVRRKVMAEMARVTKPQGKLIIVDYSLPQEKLKRFFFYHFVRLYESKYFPEFIRSDLQGMVNGTGLKFNAFCEYAFGCVKIWKYEKM